MHNLKRVGSGNGCNLPHLTELALATNSLLENIGAPLQIGPCDLDVEEDQDDENDSIEMEVMGTNVVVSAS